KLFKTFLKFNPFLNAHKSLKNIIKNEKLLKTLEFDFLFLGTDPKKAPAVYGIINYFLFKQGVFYPEGGIYKIIESMIRIGKKLNIEFYNNSPVSEIIIKNYKAIGVKLKNGEIIEGNYIISNADLFHTETKLIKEIKYQTYNENYWKKIKIAPSGFIIYLGLNQKIQEFEHHNFYFSKDWDLNFKQIFNYNDLPNDPSFYVCMPSKTDSTISPQNKDQLFILIPISVGNYLNQKNKNEFKEKIYKTIENKMIGKNLTKMIEFEKIYSIDDFKKDYNALEGTALGIIHDLKQTLFRPKNQSKKVKNLYYVGGYVNPGIGMPMVLASAQIVYKKILNIKRKGPLTSI
ncbi:MAG: phytoene desaturase family protein, partial [bacterium]|nr:phytoene desaturase family protein [bacterium]